MLSWSGRCWLAAVGLVVLGSVAQAQDQTERLLWDTVRSSSRADQIEVYLRAYDSVGEARMSIGRYLTFYNHKRPHSGLDAQTPDQAYFAGLPQAVAA